MNKLVTQFITKRPWSPSKLTIWIIFATKYKEVLSKYVHYVNAKHFRANMPQVNTTSFFDTLWTYTSNTAKVIVNKSCLKANQKSQLPLGLWI